MNFLSGARIRVHSIFEVIFTKNVWAFSRDQVNCPYWRGVRKERFGCINKTLPVKNRATKDISEHDIHCLSQSGKTATVTNKTMKNEIYGIADFHMNFLSASCPSSLGSNLSKARKRKYKGTYKVFEMHNPCFHMIKPNMGLHLVKSGKFHLI